MKFKILLATLVLFTMPSMAQVKMSYPILCVSEEVLEATLKKYGEKPFLQMLTMRAVDSTFEEYAEVSTVLFANRETRSWTLVERASSGMYCVVSAGDQLRPQK